MYPLKKITKEDTWRPDDLKVHIKEHHEESRRRDRSKREGEHRKHRDGDSLDHQHRHPDQDARRDREKQRENTKGGSKHRDPDRDINQDSKGEEVRDDRYKEKCRKQEKAVDCSSHRDGDKQSEAKRHEMENSKRRRNREKDRYNDGDIGMYKQRDRDIEKGRKKDGEKERKIENDRWKEEKQEDLDHSRTEERVKDKERDRRERHRARKSDYSRHDNEEKPREGDRRSDKAHSGHKEREHRIDRENGEKRRRDKESHEADTSHSRDVEREHGHQERKEPKDYLHDIKDGYKERMKARERKEQDRQRERKHKEDSDSKRNDRKQTEKHKESSGHKHRDRINRDKEESTAIPQLTWRSIQAQMSDPEIPVENEETEEDKQSGKDYRNDDYEEDFENYEEDFEDEDEEEDDKDEVDHDNRGREEKRELSPRRREEIEAIQRAIDEENERISSARSQRTTTESAFPYRENHSNRGRTHGKIIDFVSAKHREINQKVAKKQKKRSEKLLRLIDLDFSITFSLLDLPPVNEYDMYIKNFGTTNTKQAYVQCNEDNVDRDIQTEEVEMMDKWTQHPPEAKAACGGTKVSQDTTDESMARMTTDSQRLTVFLRSAKQVMAVLIEENMAESNSLRRLCSQTDALSFSDGCLQLNTELPFLHGRQVSLLQFSHIQRQTLLSVHPPSSKTSAVPLNSETIICVWIIWEPSRPQKILLYESEVMCCCFSPGKVTLVFAGTSVGSVVVWDLREHSGTHCNLVVGKVDWTLRYPTFSTDAVLSGLGHLSPVVSIEPVLSTAETGSNSILTADIDESLGLSFQLGSLDENGVLTLWVVVELPKGNYSGSQTDLGLRPGGKVKLLHSSSLQTTEKSLQHIIGCGPPLSLQLKFLPSDSNHYFVGTNMGLVRHGTRHSLKVLPKFYRSQFDSCKPVEVTTLDFSPSGEPFFLVGCSDGTVRLHSVLREAPLMEWSGCSICTPILSVLWSQTRPAVFCVLDAASDLHIWDLTEKDYMPVITENIHNDRVTAMAVFGEPAKQNTFSGIALAKQSGKVEIQYFKKSLTVSKASDKEKLQSVLRDTF